MDYLYIVATNKAVLVTIRIAPNVRDQFKKAAELRGSTMSGLMHQFIVQTIREEMEAAPQEFKRRGLRAAEVTMISSPKAEDEHLKRQLANELTAEPPRKRKTG